MLVFSRKINESIVIGEHVVVTVVEIYEDRVRLGIEAPRAVAVHRREILERISGAEATGDARRTDAASEDADRP
jgi:carbon storage regulator